MKQIFTLAFTIMSWSLPAQWGQNSGNVILSFEAGYSNFRPFALNNHIINSGASTQLSYFETFGIGNLGAMAISRGGNVDGATALHFYKPVDITADSLRYQFRGWELMTSAYGFEVLPRVRAVDFIVAPGVFWGNIKMRKYFSGGNPKQYELFKNPFVAPMIRADLRFQLGPVSIGGRWSYRYDISKEHWKKGSSEILPGYKAREMQYMVYLGYVVNWKE